MIQRWVLWWTLELRIFLKIWSGVVTSAFFAKLWRLLDWLKKWPWHKQVRKGGKVQTVTTYLVSVLLFSSFSLSLPLFVSAEVAGDLNGLYWEPLLEMTWMESWECRPFSGLPLLSLQPWPFPCLGIPVVGGLAVGGPRLRQRCLAKAGGKMAPALDAWG